MRIRRLMSLAGGLVLMASATAGAQESGKAGVVLGYPGAVGVIWHATENVAIRPDFTFSRSTSETSSDSWGFGTNIGALFYLKKYDNVRTYVSPQFTYARTRVTSSLSASSQGVLPDLTVTSTTTGGAATFGAQYSPGPRFAVYGEVGIGFSRRRAGATSNLVGPLKGTAWGTTSGVGVVFYP